MTDLEKAARLALDALEWHYSQGHSNTLGGFRLKIDQKALRSLKAALAKSAQPAPVADKAQCDGGQCGVGGYCETCPKQQAEPVAWIPRDHLRQARFGPFLCRVEPTQRRPDFVALYTAPPAPQQAEPVVERICRTDGRCQYAIDHGAEDLGHCPKGKCVMPVGAPWLRQAEPVAELAVAERQINTTTPSEYRRGYEGGFAVGKREGRIEAEDALAQQAEPVAVQAEPVAANHKRAAASADGQSMTHGNPSY